MDPELIKFARAAEAAARQRDPNIKATEIGRDWLTWYAANNGGRYTADQIERVMPLLESRSTVGGMANAALQGFAGGFADEAMGSVDGQQGRDVARGMETVFRQEHPGLSIGSEIAGSVLNPLMKLFKLGKARTITKGMTQGAKVGGAIGLEQGIGRAEGGLGERLKGGAVGATVGAVTGPIIPGIVGVGAKILAGPKQRAMQALANTLETALPEEGIAGKGIPAVEAQLAKLRALGMSDDAILADLSPSLRGRLELATVRSDRVYRQAGALNRARQQGQASRIQGAVGEGTAKTLGSTADDLDATLRSASLKQSKDQWAAKAYDDLDALNGGGMLPNIVGKITKPTTINTGLVDASGKAITRAGTEEVTGLLPAGKLLATILDQPKVKQAYGKAVALGLIGKPPVPSSELTFRTLHQVKQDLDDAISTAFAQKRGRLGNDLKEVRKILIDELEQRVPGYKGVNSEYAARSAVIDALKEGQKAFRTPFASTGALEAKITSIVESRGAAMTPAIKRQALDEFRRGMASEIIKDLRTALTNRNSVAKYVDRSDDMADKLRVVFKDEATFNRFIDRMGGEGLFAQLAGAIGGVPTARRMLAQEGMEGFLGSLGTGFGSGINWIKAAIARQLVKRTSSMSSTHTAEALGPMLMAKGQKNIDAVIAEALNSPAVTGRAAHTFAPGASTTGLLSLFNR